MEGFHSSILPLFHPSTLPSFLADATFRFHSSEPLTLYAL